MKRWKRLAVLLVIGALVVGGALFYKHQKKMAKAEQLRSESLIMISKADIYKVSPENAEYIKGLAVAAHAAGTRALGAGLFATALDEKDYYTGLFNDMVRRAKADNRPEVARSLRDFAVGRKYLDVTDR
jgi:hypothetical protein